LVSYLRALLEKRSDDDGRTFQLHQGLHDSFEITRQHVLPQRGHSYPPTSTSTPFRSTIHTYVPSYVLDRSRSLHSREHTTHNILNYVSEDRRSCEADKRTTPERREQCRLSLATPVLSPLANSPKNRGGELQAMCLARVWQS
jgi:hypothetical protein